MRFQTSVGLVALLMICGCRGSDGPTLVRTTGTVLYNGKPLAGATVTMIGEKGLLSNGFTDRDGKFQMTTGGRPGVPIGIAKVGITKISGEPVVKSTKPPSPDDMRSMQEAADGTAKDLSPKSDIPLKYSDPQQSQLTASIDRNSGKNVFEFPLVD